MNYTKADMLELIRTNCREINILPMFVLDCKNFFEDERKVINCIIDFAKGEKIIVRSSSVDEDRSSFSNAGGFESVLDVNPTYDEVCSAIKKVIKSYNSCINQQILIQPMLVDIKRSGVIFTSDMDTLSDYYIVNYYIGNDSTAVTGGVVKNTKTYIRYKKATNKSLYPEMDDLINICKRIESFLGNSSLDIEFGINNSGMIYIFQVRPIAIGNKSIPDEKTDISTALLRIYKKIEKLSVPHPFLLGDNTVYGTMPDWNPAEILGIRPKKMAISLYKELITDAVWAVQRNDYGYRDLSKHPLMVSFCGIPYIDTRITFNSFVPKKLHEKIANKLVNFYLDKLRKYPKYHDKIEFEIVYSCYYFGIHDDLKELLTCGFNENEINRIEYSLLELTNSIISPEAGLYKMDLKKSRRLSSDYEKIVKSDLSTVEKIYWLIEECKEFGTRPFAGVARAAFIGIQFLNSFVKRNIITKEEYDLFMNSINTINKQLQDDLYKYRNKQVSKQYMVDKYGHIRPGTYDIQAERYDENFERYFVCAMDCNHEKRRNISDFAFSNKQIELIQDELDENGLTVSAEDLICFIKESIEGREYLKFEFTRFVSELLVLIEELGERVDIAREDMSFLDISIVKQLYSDLYVGNIHDLFIDNINKNKTQYRYATLIKLPSIISHPSDIYEYELLDEEPNFITQKKIISDTICNDLENVEGKIVFIQSADPGYDFLFSKNIAGLITQFGGANSHMAIRCAELGIPAVIGAGEKKYTQWLKGRTLLLDCVKRQVIVLKEK